jgi:DNA-binding GntR family transcriptional regulator
LKKQFDLGYRSLKNLVYDYLRDQMQRGELKPGDPINMDQTAKKLGISKTPLREALIKLETEGFVKIIPWRGVLVSALTLQDFKDCYQIIGALESTAILAAAPRLKKHDITRMQILNEEMKEAIEAGDFDAYYEKNIQFHKTYLHLSKNQILIDAVDTLKKKLYEFTRPKEFLKEWEDVSLAEHQKLIDFLQRGEFQKGADLLKNTIWSFEVQEKYIVKYYRFENREE